MELNVFKKITVPCLVGNCSMDKIDIGNGQTKAKLEYVELTNRVRDRLIKLIGDSTKHVICDTIPNSLFVLFLIVVATQ